MSGKHASIPSQNAFPIAERIPLPTPQPAATPEYVPGETEVELKPEAIKPEFHWPVKPCSYGPKSGCYRISFTPGFSLLHYHGTMRIDLGEDDMAASGDLYKHRFHFPWISGFRQLSKEYKLPKNLINNLFEASKFTPVKKYGIPIYSRDTYYSYLKVTGLNTDWLNKTLNITMEEHVYDHVSESFSYSRTVEAILTQTTPPAGFSGNQYYSGTLYDSGIPLGGFSMGWVSKYFRKASLEVDVVEGAVAPQSVNVNGKTHSFKTIMATAGWDLKEIYDETEIPNTYTGGSVNWSHAELHQAMQDVRNPSIDLDDEWRLHLLVVPENMGSGRGVMYDQFGEHREGVASFSDDGYPLADSANWGTAQGQLQRDVPTGFLRSAAHEVGHGFNMQHQSLTFYGEPGNDATIMTTSPEVADYLASVGDAYPDDIEFRFNEHCRHHLAHFPDQVVRPGGASWGAGHSTTVPQADQEHYWFGEDELLLTAMLESKRLKLAEPLKVRLALKNMAQYDIITPKYISPDYMHGMVTVIDPMGNRKPMPSFVMRTDSGGVQVLKPNKSLETEATVFWSSKGFAFEVPGKHTIEFQITWNVEGVPCGVTTKESIWVDSPVVDADNDVASMLLDDEVGMWVMLGGSRHLKKANEVIDKVIKEHSRHAACKTLQGYMKSITTTRIGKKAEYAETVDE